jgi:hypothetical protein
MKIRSLLFALPALSFTSLAYCLEQPPKAEAQGQSLLTGQAESTPETLTVSFNTEDKPTAWTHVYLQTDADEETGHRHWSDLDGRKGLDYLVEGSTLYVWSGKDDVRGWHWTAVPGGGVTRSENGTEVVLEIPWTSLEVTEGEKVSLFIATATENFADTLDLLPREGGTLEVTVPKVPKKKAVSTPAKDARPRFKKIQSYACYYGKGQVEALKTRDAVIIETKSQTPESVAEIRKDGTLAIGYISAGEDDQLRKGDGKGPGGFDSAYFDRNHDDKPDKNEIWSSYFTDAATESWINHFLGKAKQMKEEYGVDGFFLDTVETFTLYTENRKPMVELIRRLREQNPDSVIVINRGWDLLADLDDVVDGLMYESFTLSYDFGTKSYVRMRPSALDEGRMIHDRFLKPAQEKHGLVVLALDYAAEPDAPGIQDSVDRAVSFNMIPEITTIYLDHIFPPKYKGQKNEKWLKDFLTPESMAYTTSKEINGFPAGTRVMPSSLYPDYEVSPVLDGQTNKVALGWRNRAWASNERPDPHWIEFQMPKAQPVSEVKVTWATDNGEAFPSKNFAVEVVPAGAAIDAWKTVWKTNENHSKTCVVKFPETEVLRIRIAQEAEGGSTARPNLMWMEQVAIAR